MSLTISNPLSAEDYDRRLKDFIKSLEGEELKVYVDCVRDKNGNLLRGNPTIGWGFALNNNFSITNGGPRNPEALDYFLSTVLEVNPERDALSTKAIECEKYWQSELKRVLNSSWISDNTSSHTGSSIALQNALNAVLQNRAADILTSNYNANDRLLIGTPRTEFKYENTEEVEATFDAFKQTKEKRLNDVFGANSPVLSNERIALYSMAYQGTLSGERKAALVAALNLQNSKDAHAEAWFVIRYMRTSEAWRGYMESAMFGLYESSSNVQLTDAQAVYRMLNLHRKTILDYETNNQAELTSANQKIQQAGMSGIYTVLTIEAALDPAKSKVLSDLCNRYDEFADKLQDSAIKSTNIYMNPSNMMPGLLDARQYETTTAGEDDVMIGNDSRDTILGGAGNDVLIGEGGNDYLEGGKGDDVLIGGPGFDTYYYKAGDGNDQIKDTGENQIIIEKANGEFELIQALYKTGDNIWTTPDGEIEITHHSPWQIVLEDGSTLTLGENLQDGDFGIKLRDIPSNPSTSNEIVEDNWSHEAFYGGIIDTASKHLLVV